MVYPIRGLTQIYLTTTACWACEKYDQLWGLCCTAEGLWCVRLCPRCWTLDSGPTDEYFLNSGSPELLAHSKWDLYVRVLYCVGLPLSCTSIRTYSWEYVTTLHFELDIIRGRRSYRWTIWVCSDRSFSPVVLSALRFRADLTLARSVDILACAHSPSYRHSS